MGAGDGGRKPRYGGLLLGLVTANHDLARKGGKTLGLLALLWGITSALLSVGWHWHVLH
jgi:hypothetical protein